MYESLLSITSNHFIVRVIISIYLNKTGASEHCKCNKRLVHFNPCMYFFHYHPFSPCYYVSHPWNRRHYGFHDESECHYRVKSSLLSTISSCLCRFLSDSHHSVYSLSYLMSISFEYLSYNLKKTHLNFLYY